MTKQLSPAQREELLDTLKTRFKKAMHLHKGIDWAKVQEKLEAKPEKLWALNEMEITGGEPDVIGRDEKTSEYIFADCSAESPKGRRSLCYDREALESRKEHAPEDSAMDMAAEIGIGILTEEEYRELQTLAEFDLKTSSWVKTPPEMRKLGGAIFLRPSLRQGIRVPQRRSVVLCRSLVSWFATSLKERRRITADTALHLNKYFGIRLHSGLGFRTVTTLRKNGF